MLRPLLFCISVFGACPSGVWDEAKLEWVPGATWETLPKPNDDNEYHATQRCCKVPGGVGGAGLVPMTCAPNTEGWANVQMGGATDPVKIEFKRKEKDVTGPFTETFTSEGVTTDSDNVVHPATIGTFSYNAADGRFEIDEKQTNPATGPTAGNKMIKITVTRPKELLAFGGEWVKMYEKDSWTNITNEYEPYTFNDFGSKVALQQFRPTSEETEEDGGGMIADDADPNGELNVFMALEKNGDYEIRYGNPRLVTDDGKWISLEFINHQLRVGNPFDKSKNPNVYDNIGAIVPVYLGNPALLFHSYKNVATTMTGAINAEGATKKVATKVILPIFTPGTESADGWSDGTDAGTEDGGTSEGRNGWTRGSDFAGTTADCTDCLKGKECDKDNQCTFKKYKGCYSSGKACTMDHSVCDPANCEINKWNEIIDEFHKDTNIEAIGLIETKEADGTSRDPEVIKADIQKYLDHTSGIKGFYFNEVVTKKTVETDAASPIEDEQKTVKDLMDISAAKDLDSKFTVFGLGQPLFQPKLEDGSSLITAAGAPDVWVTLNDDYDGLGVWTPYSWFSDVSSGHWGAIVSDVAETNVNKTLKLLFDRGYGYVYLHQDSLFNETSGHLDKMIKGIGNIKDGIELTVPVEDPVRQLRGRGLQTQDDGVETTKYECDDTLFECQPVCMRTRGVTRSKVSDEKCSGVKPTQCSCRCYYDAYWTCENDAVVCKASMSGGGARTVGDLVCITRGTPKPDWDPTAQTRTAGQCEKLDVERKRRPTDQCLAEYAAAKPEEPKAVEEVAETPGAITMPELGGQSLPELELMGSAVHVAVGAALLALA